MADIPPRETPRTAPADMTRPQLEQSVTVARRRAVIQWMTSAIIIIVVLVIAYANRIGHG